MNFVHESFGADSKMLTTCIHSNGYGGIRIEIAEEEVMNEYGGRKLVDFKSSVMDKEHAEKLRDDLLKQFPLEK